MNGKARGKKDGLIVVYKMDCMLAARAIITREMKRHVLRDTKKKVPGRSPSTSEALQNRLLEVSLQSQILTGCISFVRPKASPVRGCWIYRQQQRAFGRTTIGQLEF